MKNEKVKTVSYNKTETESIVCDLCGAVHMGDKWETDTMFDVSETTIELKDGYIFPEGRNITETTFDICPNCFREKLIPWLESQGAKPTIIDFD